MDPAIAEILGPVTAILGLGTMILIGVKLRYSHKEKMRLGEGGSAETGRLGEDVAVGRPFADRRSGAVVLHHDGLDPARLDEIRAAEVEGGVRVDRHWGARHWLAHLPKRWGRAANCDRVGPAISATRTGFGHRVSRR